jgi:hypothetical protein
MTSVGGTAGELMDAVGGSNTFSGRHAFTALTLALLEDTGWCACYSCTRQGSIADWASVQAPAAPCRAAASRRVRAQVYCILQHRRIQSVGLAGGMRLCAGDVYGYDFA